jgi:hypothetical protein
MRERWTIALLIAVSIIALATAAPYMSQPVYGTSVLHGFARVSPFQTVNGTTATGTTATGTTATGTTATGTTATGTTATGTTASTTATGTTATGTTQTGTTATGTTVTGTTATGTTASTTTIPIVGVTVDSSPHGMGVVMVDGSPVTTPTVYSMQSGSMHTLSAVGSLSCGISCQYVFQSWSDGGGQNHTITVPNFPVSYTATYQQQYLLTIQSNAEGSVAPPTGYQNANAVIPILGTPNSGFSFVSWTGSGSGSFSGSSASATVTMNGPITETATFAPASTVQITVGSNPSSSGAIQVDGSSITTPQTFSWTPGTTHTLFATYNPPCNYNCQATFLFWTSSSIGTVNSQSITYVVPSSTETVTAVYQIIQPQATASITISSSPSGLNYIYVDGTQITTPQTFNWQRGSTHTLSASRYCGTSGCQTQFSYWQSQSVGTTNAASFTYTVPTYSETVTAYYQSSQNVPIQITEIPPGSGSLAVDGIPIIISQTFYWTAGSTHTLSAQNGNGQFVSWTAPSIGTTNANTLTYVVPSSGETVAAYYNAPAPQMLIPITITTSLTGPTVAVDGVLTTTPHTYFWAAGSQHVISVTDVNCPLGSCPFTSWTAPSIGAVYSTTITYTAPPAGEIVTANFTQATPVPEFNGVAVVVFSAWASSMYALRRRRRQS